MNQVLTVYRRGKLIFLLSLLFSNLLLGISPSEGEQLVIQAQYLYTQGEFELAIETIRKARYVFRSDSNWRGEIQSELLLGGFYSDAGLMDSTRATVDRAYLAGAGNFEDHDTVLAEIKYFSGIHYLYTDQFENALEDFHTALDIFQLNESNLNTLASTYQYLSQCHAGFGDKLEQKNYADTSLFLSWNYLKQIGFNIEQESVSEPVQLFSLRTFLLALGQSGLSYLGIGEVEKGESRVLTAYKISEKYLAPTDAIYCGLMVLLSSYYSKILEYEKAISWGEKALQESEKAGINGENEATLCLSLAKNYHELGDTAAATYMLALAKKKFAHFYPESHQAMAGYYLQLGMQYYSFGKLEFSNLAFEKVLKLTSQELIPWLEVQKVIAYYYLSKIEMDRNEFDLAEEYAKSALLNIGAAKWSGAKREVDLLLQLGKLYQLQGRNNDAEREYKKAISKANSLQLPKLIQGYLGLAEIELSQDNFQLASVWADSAVTTYDKYLSFGGSRQLKERKSVLINRLIEVKLEAAINESRIEGIILNVEELFALIQKGQNVTLQEVGMSKKAFEAGMLPIEIENKQRTINRKISYWHSMLLGKDGDPEKAYDELVIAYSQMDTLSKFIKRNYPGYSDFIYSGNPVTIEEVQNSIKKDNELLLSYLQGEDNVYLIVISKKESKFYRISEGAKLKQLVPDYLSEILKSEYDPEEDSIGMKLSELLFGQIDHLEKYSQLTIIKNGQLNYLPFEALPLPPKVRSKDHALFIDRYAVNFTSTAANFLIDNNTVDSSLSFGMVSCFPDWDGYATSLRGGIDLQSELEARFKGVHLSGDQCTKDRLASIPAKNSIIQVFSHSIMEDQYPSRSRLLLSPSVPLDSVEFLFLDEIFPLDLKGSVAILSTCESGMGKLAKGEGLLSLERAFQFAGCRATISSLWEVDDHATAQLMSFFYDGLEQGLSMNEALRQAKLQYRSTAVSEFSSPYFWAGLEAHGKTGPIWLKTNPPQDFFGENRTTLLIIGGILVLAVLTYFTRRRKKVYQ